MRSNFYQIFKVLKDGMFLFLLAPLFCLGEKLPRVGDLKTEVLSYKSASGETAEYQTGTFYVKENRKNQNSRVIGIGFSRFPSTNSKAPPIFFLPGGPGSSFLDSVPPRLHRSGGPLLAEELLGRCDLVFVDQRGYSKRGSMLDDRAFEQGVVRPDATLEDRVVEFKRFSREVVERYGKTDVDLRGYSVLECVEDVNELRQLLGYEKIILRGQSFGSQWSFGLMRKYPETVERALLTGIEPLNNGYDMPSHVFNAIRRIWKSIDEDPRFKPYLPPGGMEFAAETVIKRLETDPIKIYSKGKPKPVRIIVPDDFPWRDPTAILELYHGQLKRWESPRILRVLPRTLLQPLIDSSLGTTEKRRWKLWNDPATRYLSRSNFAPLLATAEIWPSPDVGDDFRIPVRCEVPVVFVNGDWDTKTPVENMYEIAPYFPNGRQVVVHRAGHGTMKLSTKEQHPEFIERLVKFLKTGQIRGLPASVTVRPYQTFRSPDFDL
ncbi:MAG: hypothetical protein CMI29_01730 [Opitutae bacterium]|nr:hypothetical protein [Opitutae bacterium]